MAGKALRRENAKPNTAIEMVLLVVATCS
jgi:hypothetical protein